MRAWKPNARTALRPSRRAPAITAALGALLAVGLTASGCGGPQGSVGDVAKGTAEPAPSRSASTGPSASATMLPPKPVPSPAHGELPWVSGVYVPGSSPSRVAAFAAWRDQPVDVAVDWPDRQTWDDIVNPFWVFNLWRGTPYTLALGIAPLPEGVPSANLAACAAGEYNSQWVTLGKNLQASGRAEGIIVRFGWEFNGDWYKWSAHNPADFAACWRNAYTNAEKSAPGLRWEWTVNRGEGQSVPDARKAYPGDEYVDIVGVDAYDMWPGATNEATWKQQLDGPYGLNFWAAFAREHGKKLSVPEWGVYPGTAFPGNNGGDNPFYIEKMTGFFREHAGELAYEAYFNEEAPYYAGSLYQPAQNPKAAAAYLSAYRP